MKISLSAWPCLRWGKVFRQHEQTKMYQNDPQVLEFCIHRRYNYTFPKCVLWFPLTVCFERPTRCVFRAEFAGFGACPFHQKHYRCCANSIKDSCCYIVVTVMFINACMANQAIIEGSLNSKLPTIWRVEKQMKSR